MTSNLNNIIEGGYCIGCGACTLGNGASTISIRLNDLGYYQAEETGAEKSQSEISATVCPFSDTSRNEDEIAARLFSAPEIIEDSRMGRYLSVHAGHVADGSFRALGSSGGFTSWIMAELLNRGMIDAVIHVRPRIPDEESPAMFRYEVSGSVAELQRGAKSHYYPVEMSGILTHIRDHPARYAVVGVPCFIKAIRLLSDQEPVFRERVKFCIGLFCGHLKSTGFAELLSWQCGIKPSQLQAIDFRTKLADRPSSGYGVTVSSVEDGRKVSRTNFMSELTGSDWGMGFFKYKACDFCDDISSETADVSVGDAWLPQFLNESRGTNIVIVRNAEIQTLVVEGIQSGALKLNPLSLDDAIESQSANFRHRRQDLPYRLHIEDLAGRWRPRKRVDAADIPKTSGRRKVQDQRIHFRDQVPQLWQAAVKANSLELFMRSIESLLRDYRAAYHPQPRPPNRIKALIKRALRALR